jgi:hypothetical protein
MKTRRCAVSIVLALLAFGGMAKVHADYYFEFDENHTVDQYAYDSINGPNFSGNKYWRLERVAGALSVLNAANPIPNPHGGTFFHPHGTDGPSANNYSVNNAHFRVTTSLFQMQGPNDGSSWTLEGWFQIETDTTDMRWIAGTRNTGFNYNNDNAGWRFIMDSMKLRVQMYHADNTYRQVLGTTTLTAGTSPRIWYHFAIVYDHDSNVNGAPDTDGSVKLYLNGKLEGQGAAYGDLVAGTAARWFSVGAWNVNNNPWVGRFDEWRYSDHKTLTPSQFLNYVAPQGTVFMIR